MFKTKTPLLIAALNALGSSSGLALAETETEELVFVEAEPPVNELELGIGYISDDSYYFGRYNGMFEKGPYAIGDVKAKKYGERGDFWRLRGTNLGLDSRYLRFDAGVQGNKTYFIQYDQLPDYENDTGKTPFLGEGSTDLRLLPGMDSGNVEDYLQPFEQQTERKRLRVGGKLFFKQRWNFTTKFSHETKDGTDWIGGAMGPDRLDNIFKWTYGALLPEPVDQETNKFNFALNYNDKKTQLEFAYNASLFYNANDSLSWDQPIFLDSNGNQINKVEDRTHRQSLEPDNQYQQLSATLGHSFSPANRLTGVASVALMTQDEDFLPYSVFDTTDSLPRTSADAEVWLYNAQLKWIGRPLPKLRLSAQYSFDERDNKTPVTDYNYILADGINFKDDEPIKGEINPRANNPLSYQKNKVDLTGNYRFTSWLSLRGDYRYKHTKRESTDQARYITEDHTLYAKFKIKPHSTLNLDLYGEAGKRTGSTYHTRLNENPNLRVYYLADVERTKTGVYLGYMPTDRLSFGLTTEYLKNDYTESELGLTESKQTNALFNVNYQITNKINAHAFYNYQEYSSNNANENLEVEKGEFDYWEADLKDSIDSFGLGLSFEDLADKWDVGVDWVYTRSRGETYMSGLESKWVPESDPRNYNYQDQPIDADQFPDLKTELNSLQLWASYQYNDKIAYKFSYWYENYNSEDWTVDDVDVNSVQQFLLLGEDRLDYSQHVVGVAVNVKF